MDMELAFITMEINTLAISNLVNYKDLVHYYFLMVKCIKVITKKMLKKEMEYIDGQMVVFMKASGRIIINMAKVNCHGQMERSMMEIGFRDFIKDKG